MSLSPATARSVTRFHRIFWNRPRIGLESHWPDPHRPGHAGQLADGYCAPVRSSSSELDVLDEQDLSQPWLRRYRWDLLWGALICALLLAGFWVPHLHLTWLSPVVHQTPRDYRTLADTAPLLAAWGPHASPATPCAVALAIAVVAWGPRVAARLPWSGMVLATWAAALAWTMALTLIDGWKRGFVDHLVGHFNYLSDVHRVHGIHAFFAHFASHIPSPHAGSWDIETSAHPPLGLLTFALLHRVGLSGPVWASLLVVVVGSSAAAAVVITVRRLHGEPLARRVALSPAAVFVGVSSDGYYAGVAAWGLTLLAIAATSVGRRSIGVALGAGVLLGITVYLSYGMALLAIPALAILVATRNYRPVVATALGALTVAGVVTALGFWWFTGLALLRHRYLTTIAMDRPFAYWSWGDLAALTCAIGLPAALGLRRAFNATQLRARSGLHLLLAAFVVAVAVADVSALSKAETERIWLPFAVWLVAGAALLPRPTHRYALALQAIGALLINSLLFTLW